MSVERLDPEKMYQYFSAFGHLNRDEALPYIRGLSESLVDPVNLMIALGCCASFTVGFFWHPVPGPGDTVKWEPHSHINHQVIEPFTKMLDQHYPLFSRLVQALLNFEVPDYLPTLSPKDMMFTLTQGMTVCGQLVRAFDLHEINQLG